MNGRLYYDDSYRTHFEATVVEQLQVDGRPAVRLAEGYFYPTSGGQPHDTGQIGPRRVVDVSVRADDYAVLHVLDGPLAPGRYPAVVDWARRFDHMQQHTGQHILSQAFVQTAGAQTIGFHLGEDICTIDLDTAEFGATAWTAVEALANAVVWENRPIRTRQISAAEAAQLPLRKQPATPGDSVRLVEIADFDLTPCGGTHVAATGAVGLIKLVKQERMRGSARAVFLCGGRATADYGHKLALVQHLTAEFTCAPDEIATAVQRLRTEVKEAQRALRRFDDLRLQLEMEQLRNTAVERGAYRLIRVVFDERDPADARRLVQALIEQDGLIVLCGLRGAQGSLIFGRSAAAPGHMGQLLQQALNPLQGRGGGSAHLAQGGGFTGRADAVEAALETAERALLTLSH